MSKKKFAKYSTATSGYTFNAIVENVMKSVVKKTDGVTTINPEWLIVNGGYTIEHASFDVDRNSGDLTIVTCKMKIGGDKNNKCPGFQPEFSMTPKGDFVSKAVARFIIDNDLPEGIDPNDYTEEDFTFEWLKGGISMNITDALKDQDKPEEKVLVVAKFPIKVRQVEHFSIGENKVGEAALTERMEEPTNGQLQEEHRSEFA